ncbi:MAG: GNAT family N-acetyltransferase [Gammaproteobacteria bacterium]|nr:GNAT family N-acetyltransferase [Gammaproteobacteria bacterium]
MTIQFQVKQTSWEESKRELIRIRTVVFINEQLVPPELEWDGYDQNCWQVIARTTDGESIGTGRMLYDGHIGRMAVLPQYRKTGVGSALLSELINIARLQGINEVFLHAQIRAVVFYQKAGFVITSDEFMDAGIPHVAMRLILAKTV